jgi:hypothetical protein
MMNGMDTLRGSESSFSSRRFLGQTTVALAGVAGLQLTAAAQQEAPILSAQMTNAADQGSPMASRTGEASISRPGILNGKVAVVTGAARGIGRAAAVALARSGAQSQASTSAPW